MDDTDKQTLTETIEKKLESLKDKPEAREKFKTETKAWITEIKTIEGSIDSIPEFETEIKNNITKINLLPTDQFTHISKDILKRINIQE